MTTWIIAYSKDGNTATLKTDSEQKPDMDRAIELVTAKAEKEYVEQDVEPTSDEEQTPATRLADRFGITITGISQA
ncbi:hypothetical protein DN824_17110 [Stutzerimonas nosocomialis]|uniref:Uncharacterized protein n=1 Tax=Stutzerimonas nosocomialis TaxID=1056496 RepID=A0A5R9QFU5_9GAMM|nr:hypothetical protein [Stutzerimonas nosocomialis]TLX54376.1 hypothetical protein DN826_14450 [Stutzerimonas nosocomialis]TLX56156.1 hypothetical protein DN824_17110 [Stutzerimonas nosocomialis]TLX64049.1 hypothetical protein DN820_08560 [Stutzerimonas nosocomialis]